jgi:diacylglycerol kinase (ATP)
MNDIPLLILNGKAGSQDHAQFKDIVAQRGYRLSQTNYAGHGTEMAQRAAMEGTNLIIAGGGDGTVREVAKGIVLSEKDTTLGIIPLGTGNDLCRSLDIDNDIEKALQLIDIGKKVDIDVAELTITGKKHLFFNVSSCGFGGAVDKKLEETDKTTWGPLTYFKSGLAALTELESFKVDIFSEDETISVDSLNIIIGNGRYAAAGIPVAPQASLTDGKLDVVLYMGKDLGDQIFNSRLILQGEQECADNILSLRAKKFAMKFSKPVNINYDGELYKKEVDEISYAIHSRRLKVIVGKNFT